jgi:hypothetical protein
MEFPGCDSLLWGVPSADLSVTEDCIVWRGFGVPVDDGEASGWLPFEDSDDLGLHILPIRQRCCSGIWHGVFPPISSDGDSV